MKKSIRNQYFPSSWFQTWMDYFPFHIWDVIRNPLTNSIIFQHGFCTTNQPWITPQKIRKNHQKIETNKKNTRKSRKNPEKPKKNTKIPWRIPWSRSSWSFRLAEAKKRAFEATIVQKNYGKICGLMWFNGIVCLFLFTLLQIEHGHGK